MREIDAAAVRLALTPDRCREAMRAVFAAHARGETQLPVRMAVPMPGGVGTLLVMPASVNAPRAVGAKLLTVVPGNAARGLPVNRGTVVMLDPGTGAPLAALDGAMVTALRTAAVSALATELLARPDARSLLIVGGGVQAASHLEAMLHVRPFARVRVWSRRAEQAAARVAELRDGALRLPTGADARTLDVSVAPDLEAAVRDADVICLVTASPVPLFSGAAVRAGTHVNTAGAHTPGTREVDTALVVRARCVVDDRAAALAESGALVLPIAEGAIAASHIAATLGDVVAGRARPRTSDADVTLFVSLGLAIEDVAAGAAVLAVTG